MKEKEPKTELETAAEEFLDLLYRYDYIGRDAYFRKNNVDVFFEGKPLYDRSRYRVFSKRKYVWMDAPYFRLGITKDGQLFKPKKYWSFDHSLGVDINSTLDPELWGKQIFRTHTRARRGLGMKYESAEIDYHNLHFRIPNSKPNRIRVT